MTAIFLTGLLTSSLYGCTGDTQPKKQVTADEINAEIDTWISTHPEGFKLNIDSGTLTDVCPAGVDCAKDRDYWAVKTGQHGLYISFKPEVVSDFTLDGLRTHFSYVGMYLEILDQDGWEVELDINVVSRKKDNHVTIESFQDGRISMLVQRESTNVWGLHDAPKCTPPEDAPLPDGCSVKREAKIPIEVRIDLPLPTPGG